MNETKPYRVLSLDGGGIRGLYTASLLHQLSLRFSRLNGDPQKGTLDLGSKFDLIVGTSTGSILAMALAAGASLEQVIALYRTEGTNIFTKQMPLQHGCLSDKIRALLWTLLRARSPANHSQPLRTALEKVLGDENFDDLYKRRKIAVCIPTINAETQKAWVFKTAHGPRLTRDNHYKLVDACMASAAAPIYFPLHGVGSPEPGVSATTWFVDGGLWANDPVLIGLAEALEFAPADRPIHILSVGTGGAPKAKPITKQESKRGILGWKGGVDIVGMSLDAQASVVPYLASRFAKSMGGRVTMHRLADPISGTEEAGYLALDAAGDKSLNLLESMAQRATDLNYSALTTGKVDEATSRAIRDMFSNL
jgi:predicted acylesterase/phospholipase RssA